jgi:hypothetical protein
MYKNSEMTNGSGERLPTKQEVDRLFSLTKAEWQAEAGKFFPSGYMIQHGKHETGLQVIGYDPATGFGFSIQPLYDNDVDPPFMVIIGNYFPAGQLSALTDELKSDMIQQAEKHLEGAYTVQVGQPPNMNDMQGIEFVLSKA